MAFTRASAALKLAKNRNNGKTPERTTPEIAKSAEKQEKLEPFCYSGRLTRSRSDGGKICHQWREKIPSFASSCKNRNGGKQCSFHYCHICLLNRYEERAEEVSVLGSKWKCPCCRGVCNCCECMKKRGCAPTGKLITMAKAQGCSSVSEMPKLEEVEKPKRNGSAAGKKRKATTEESATSSKRIRCTSGQDEKENSGVGKKGGASSKLPKSKATGGKGDVMKGKEKKGAVATRRKLPVKQEAANRRLKGVKKDLKSCDRTRKASNGSAAGKKREATTEASAPTSSKRQRHKSGLDEKEMSGVSKKGDASRRVPKTKATGGKGNIVKGKEKNVAIATRRKVPVKQEAANRRLKGVKIDLKPSQRTRKSGNAECSTATKKTNGKRKSQNVELLISQATRMTKVANLDLPAEDIGHALQFLEFCEAFRQVLDLKKGQAESLLQEMTCGQDTSKCDFSLERLHIKLLSMMGETSDNGYSSMKTRGRNSWLEALDKYISGCSSASKSLVLACSHLSRDGYSKLDGSKKLRILTFLCDEALGTKELRMWIDKKNVEFVQEKKKVKKMLEETNYRVQLKKEVTKAVLINKESHNLTHTDTGLAHNSTVVRSNPVLSDPSGRKFWKLRSCSGGAHVLLQDVANQDEVTSEEKWFVYDLKHKAGIERYISSFKESLQVGI